MGRNWTSWNDSIPWIPIPVIDPIAIANLKSEKKKSFNKTVVIFERDKCKIALAVDKFYNIIPEAEKDSEDFRKTLESFIVGFSLC